MDLLALVVVGVVGVGVVVGLMVESMQYARVERGIDARLKAIDKLIEGVDEERRG